MFNKYLRIVRSGLAVMFQSFVGIFRPASMQNITADHDSCSSLFRKKYMNKNKLWEYILICILCQPCSGQQLHWVDPDSATHPHLGRMAESTQVWVGCDRQRGRLKPCHGTVFHHKSALSTYRVKNEYINWPKSIKTFENLNLQVVDFIVILVLGFQEFVDIIDMVSINTLQLGGWISHSNNIFKYVWKDTTHLVNDAKYMFSWQWQWLHVKSRLKPSSL